MVQTRVKVQPERRPLKKLKTNGRVKGKKINKCRSVNAVHSHLGTGPPLSGLAGRLARAQAVNRAPVVYCASDFVFVREEK